MSSLRTAPHYLYDDLLFTPGPTAWVAVPADAPDTITEARAMLAAARYTQTADGTSAGVTTGLSTGVQFMALWDVIVDYAGGANGPKTQGGLLGPDASFNVNGTIQFKNGTGIGSHAHCAFQDRIRIRNFPGTTLSTLNPGLSFQANKQVIADAATITLQQNDTSDGPVCFFAQPKYLTQNVGVLTGVANSVVSYGFMSQHQVQGSSTLPRVVGYGVLDTTITGGLGDAGPGVVTEQRGVSIPRLVNAVTNVGVYCDSKVALWNDTVTVTADPGVMIEMLGDFTLNFASAAIGNLIDLQPTLRWQVDGSALNSLTGLRFRPVIRNLAASSGVDIGPISSIIAAPTLRADSKTDVTCSLVVGFQAGTTLTRVASGDILTLTANVGFRAGLTVNTAQVVTTHTGFNVKDPTGAGTVTTNIGIDIEALAKGTTNIGLRNAATTVFTPSSQAITAASQTITSTGTAHHLTSDGAYTMTSTPTIADGQDGQIVILTNETALTRITLQDRLTLTNSGLRLGSPTRSLAPGDSIVLMYHGTLGDWLELAYANAQ